MYYSLYSGGTLKLPESLSEYLTEYFECSKDHELSFPKLDCIKGTCKNSCHIVNELEKSYDWNKRVLYYQFEPVMETY